MLTKLRDVLKGEEAPLLKLGGVGSHVGRIREELGAVLGMLSPSPQHLLSEENRRLPGIFSNDWLTS